jgi:hypothetical protein
VAATIASGKCITYRDSKTNYAVVIEVGEKPLLVARGTKDSKWSETERRIGEAIRTAAQQKILEFQALPAGHPSEEDPTR